METKTPAQEAKKAEERKSRFNRRLEKRKKDLLDTMTYLFFAQRSALKDPEGQEADSLFVHLRDQWHKECMNFNARRTPFKLRYEAFAESVDFYLKKEKEQKVISKTVNQYKDFDHWKRREVKWYNYGFRLAWNYIISGGNPEKRLYLLKNYYVKNILQKND